MIQITGKLSIAQDSCAEMTKDGFKQTVLKSIASDIAIKLSDSIDDYLSIDIDFAEDGNIDIKYDAYVLDAKKVEEAISAALDEDNDGYIAKLLEAMLYESSPKNAGDIVHSMYSQMGTSAETDYSPIRDGKLTAEMPDGLTTRRESGMDSFDTPLPPSILKALTASGKSVTISTPSGTSPIFDFFSDTSHVKELPEPYDGEVTDPPRTYKYKAIR